MIQEFLRNAGLSERAQIEKILDDFVDAIEAYMDYLEHNIERRIKAEECNNAAISAILCQEDVLVNNLGKSKNEIAYEEAVHLMIMGFFLAQHILNMECEIK